MINDTTLREVIEILLRAKGLPAAMYEFGHGLESAIGPDPVAAQVNAGMVAMGYKPIGGDAVPTPAQAAVLHAYDAMGLELDDDLLKEETEDQAHSGPDATKDRLNTWWVNHAHTDWWYGPVLRIENDGNLLGDNCYYGSGWRLLSEWVRDGIYLPIPPRPVATPGKVYRQCRLPKKGERFANVYGEIETADEDWVSGGYRNSSFDGRRWIEEPAPAKPQEDPAEAAWWEEGGPGGRDGYLRLISNYATVIRCDTDRALWPTPADRDLILQAYDPDRVNITKALLTAFEALEAQVVADDRSSVYSNQLAAIKAARGAGR